MVVQACPRCAGVEFHLAGASDGAFLGSGEPNFPVCSGCGFKGPALEFEDDGAYAEFAQSVRGLASPLPTRRTNSDARPVTSTGLAVTANMFLLLGVALIVYAGWNVRAFGSLDAGSFSGFFALVYLLMPIMIAVGCFLLAMYLRTRARSPGP